MQTLPTSPQAETDQTDLEFSFRRGASSPPLQRMGFTPDEELGSWSIGTESSIVVPASLLARRHSRARLFISPCIIPGVVDAQRLSITVNGYPVYQGVIDAAAWVDVDLAPARAEPERDLVIAFRHPDAASPSAGGRSIDVRRLAIFFQRLLFVVAGPPDAASPSGDEEVHEGLDGWLFLTGGANTPIRFYTKPDFFLEHHADAWAHLLSERREKLARHGVRYIHIAAPDKLTVYPDKCTLPLHHFDRHPIGQLAASLSGRGEDDILLDLRAVFAAHPRRGEIYKKTDTHWSYVGGTIVVDAVLRHLGHAARPEIDPSRVHFAEYAGDIGSKLTPARTERFMQVAPSQHVRRTQANELAVLFETNARLGKPVLHHGIIAVFQNADPEAIEARVVIFGDSFIDFQPSNPIMAFAEAFREVHFVWSANLDYGYALKVGASVVVSELAERFMRTVPADDGFDVVANARDRHLAFVQAQARDHGA